MNIARRLLLLAAPALLPVMAMRQAKAATSDLVVLCDLTLGPLLNKAGAAFCARAGVRVFVFPTAPGLIVPQLAHEVQNDVVVTQLGLLDQAARADLLAPGAGNRSGNWRNSLVVAELTGAAGAADSGKFAVSELPSASGLDGAAVVARLGVPPARILSTIDTTETAFLLTSGAARAGVLFLTDVRADPRLRVLAPIADPPPSVYAATVTKGASRPNPAAFIAFLGSPEAAQLLAGSGLEVLA